MKQKIANTFAVLSVILFVGVWSLVGWIAFSPSQKMTTYLGDVTGYLVASAICTALTSLAFWEF
jgi:uncharacterized transporter YbjL